MTFRERLIGSFKAIALLLVALPIAVGATLISSPIWKWIESTTKIESYGHSGPAEWCYLAMYVLILVLFTLFWARSESRSGHS